MNKRTPLTLALNLDEPSLYSKYKIPGVKEKGKEYLPIVTDGSIIKGVVNVTGKSEIVFSNLEIKLLGEAGPIQKPVKIFEKNYKVQAGICRGNKKVDIPFTICCTFPSESYYGPKGMIKYSLIAFIRRPSNQVADTSTPKEVYVWRPDPSTTLYENTLKYPISIIFPFGVNSNGVERRIHLNIINSKLATDGWIEGYILIHDEYKSNLNATVNSSGPSTALASANNTQKISTVNASPHAVVATISKLNNIFYDGFSKDTIPSKETIENLGISKTVIDTINMFSNLNNNNEDLLDLNNYSDDHNIDNSREKEDNTKKPNKNDKKEVFAIENEKSSKETYSEISISEENKENSNCDHSFEDDDIIYSAENNRVPYIISDQQHFPLTSIVLELLTIEVVSGVITYKNTYSWEICNMNPQPNTKIPVRIPLRPLDLIPTISLGKTLRVFHRLGIVVTFIDPNEKKEKSLSSRGQIFIYRPMEDTLKLPKNEILNDINSEIEEVRKTQEKKAAQNNNIIYNKENEINDDADLLFNVEDENSNVEDIISDYSDEQNSSLLL